MSAMRAKMRVTNVKQYKNDAGDVTQENLSFSAVAKNSAYPEDGSDEDNTYAKFSPSASFEITVCNPVLFGKFKIDEKYYVDFTPAE
jgi:hypothetical protein